MSISDSEAVISRLAGLQIPQRNSVIMRAVMTTRTGEHAASLLGMRSDAHAQIIVSSSSLEALALPSLLASSESEGTGYVLTSEVIYGDGTLVALMRSRAHEGECLDDDPNPPAMVAFRVDEIDSKYHLRLDQCWSRWSEDGWSQADWVESGFLLPAHAIALAQHLKRDGKAWRLAWFEECLSHLNSPELHRFASQLIFGAATSGSALDETLLGLLSSIQPGEESVIAVHVAGAAEFHVTNRSGYRKAAGSHVEEVLLGIVDDYEEEEGRRQARIRAWVPGKTCSCGPREIYMPDYGRGECPCGGWDCCGMCVADEYPKWENTIRCDCATDANPKQPLQQFASQGCFADVAEMIALAGGTCQAEYPDLAAELLVGISQGLLAVRLYGFPELKPDEARSLIHEVDRLLSVLVDHAAAAAKASVSGAGALVGMMGLRPTCFELVASAMEIADANPAISATLDASIASVVNSSGASLTGGSDAEFEAAMLILRAVLKGRYLRAAQCSVALLALVPELPAARWSIVARLAIDIASSISCEELMESTITRIATFAHGSIRFSTDFEGLLDCLDGVGHPQVALDLAVDVAASADAVAPLATSSDACRCALKRLLEHGSDAQLTDWLDGYLERTTLRLPPPPELSFTFEEVDFGLTFHPAEVKRERYSQTEKGAKIQRIHPDSAAGKHQWLSVGWIVQSVNSDKGLAKRSWREVSKLLATQNRPITIVLSPPPFESYRRTGCSLPSPSNATDAAGWQKALHPNCSENPNAATVQHRACIQMMASERAALEGALSPPLQRLSLLTELLELSNRAQASVEVDRVRQRVQSIVADFTTQLSSEILSCKIQLQLPCTGRDGMLVSHGTNQPVHWDCACGLAAAQGLRSIARARIAAEALLPPDPQSLHVLQKETERLVEETALVAGTSKDTLGQRKHTIPMVQKMARTVPLCTPLAPIELVRGVFPSVKDPVEGAQSALSKAQLERHQRLMEGISGIGSGGSANFTAWRDACHAACDALHVPRKGSAQTGTPIYIKAKELMAELATDSFRKYVLAYV